MMQTIIYGLHMLSMLLWHKSILSMDFHPRLEHLPKVKFYARVSSRVSFLYLKTESSFSRLTSSSDLALSRSFLVQRSFFCGDAIAITSWAPDVVNLVRPVISWVSAFQGCPLTGVPLYYDRSFCKLSLFNFGM